MESSPWKAIAAFGVPLIVVLLAVGLLTRTIGLIHIIILVLWFGIILVTVAVAALVWKAITSPSAPQSSSTGSAADELTKLAALHQQGVLNDDELASYKRRLLGSHPRPERPHR